MNGSMSPILAPVVKRVAPFIAAVVVGGAGIGYAVHEHHDAQTSAAQAQTLTAQNAQVTAQLNTTHNQLDALAAKVNTLAASNETKPSSSAGVATGHRTGKHRTNVQDLRFTKLQSQVDAQGKEIEDARGDLVNTRTELTGSIARTHDELVVLQKKGERNYYEFDIQKSKQFKREGPISVSLRKANTKRQYADLLLIVGDRNLTQKHINLYQPAMYYQPESQQPIEVVINDISKDHIHGYISAPKYGQSELAAMSDAGANPVPGPDQLANSNAQPPTRQKLPLPKSEPNQP